MRSERKQACEITTGRRIIVATEDEVVAAKSVLLFGKRTSISYQGSSGHDAGSYPHEKAVQVGKEGEPTPFSLLFSHQRRQEQDE